MSKFCTNVHRFAVERIHCNVLCLVPRPPTSASEATWQELASRYLLTLAILENCPTSAPLHFCHRDTLTEEVDTDIAHVHCGPKCHHLWPFQRTWPPQAFRPQRSRVVLHGQCQAPRTQARSGAKEAGGHTDSCLHTRGSQQMWVELSCGIWLIYCSQYSSPFSNLVGKSIWILSMAHKRRGEHARQRRKHKNVVQQKASTCGACCKGPVHCVMQTL